MSTINQQNPCTGGVRFDFASHWLSCTRCLNYRYNLRQLTRITTNHTNNIFQALLRILGMFYSEKAAEMNSFQLRIQNWKKVWRNVELKTQPLQTVGLCTHLSVTLVCDSLNLDLFPPHGCCDWPSRGGGKDGGVVRSEVKISRGSYRSTNSD